MVDPRLADPKYLVARLTAKLSLAGVSVPPEADVQAVEVLSSIPTNVSPDDLGYILAGIYAKDEESYEKFMQVWNELLGKVPPEQIKIPVSAEGLSEKVMEDVLRKLSRRIGQRSFAPPSVEAILEYRRWHRWSLR